MNKSIVISIITFYGAATMGCADDVMGRAPVNHQGLLFSGWLDLKSLVLNKRQKSL